MERGKPFHHNRPIVLLVLSCLGLLFMPAVLAEGTVVRAVLFYAPTCPHCHQVMTEDLPPLLQEYGQQLEIVAVSTAHPDGHALYQAAIEHFAIAIERRGVPTLIIGETVLVGSLEIPQQLPGLIETHLAEGGLDWPDIPGFAEALGEAEPTVEPATATNTIPAGTPRAEHAAGATATATVPSIAGAAHAGSSPQSIRTIGGSETASALVRFRQDLAGNSLSVLVLFGMVVATVNVTVRLTRSTMPAAPATLQTVPRKQWLVLGLLVVGLAISTYMAFVETTGSVAVCGPVGDCNTVQQSEYARLFGLVPIGLVGIAGYAAMGLLWVPAYRLRKRWARLLLTGLALLGTLFSVYLTYLEPFVIGATCLWCLSSAVTTTLVLLLTVDGGRDALAELADGSVRQRWQEPSA